MPSDLTPFPRPDKSLGRAAVASERSLDASMHRTRSTLWIALSFPAALVLLAGIGWAMDGIYRVVTGHPLNFPP